MGYSNEERRNIASPSSRARHGRMYVLYTRLSGNSEQGTCDTYYAGKLWIYGWNDDLNWVHGWMGFGVGWCQASRFFFSSRFSDRFNRMNGYTSPISNSALT